METLRYYAKELFAFVFKSYYVVWKLKYINKKNDINKKFKSYYVVWKPPIFLSPYRAGFCLNRTM